MSREVVADTPTCHRSKLLLVTCSSSAQRGILIEPVYSLKLGIFWLWDALVMRHVGGQSEVNS